MNLREMFPLAVENVEASTRLDQYLSIKFPEISRSRWAHFIEEGHLRIGEHILKSSSKLKEGQVIECSQQKKATGAFAEGTGVTFTGTEPTILLEDDDLLVINKVPGVSVHPGAGTALPETLVGWLMASGRMGSEQLKDYLHLDDEIMEEQRPGIVHRLDKGTSGALLINKNPNFHQALAEQFAERKAGRLYYALVEGKLENLARHRPKYVDELLLKRPSPIGLKLSPQSYSSIVTYLSRDLKNRTRFVVNGKGEGKKAITHLMEVSGQKKYSLLELKLKTGRTHQIRVHLSFLGLPVVGDTIYGGREFRRIMLHAHQLQFEHPRTKKRVTVNAEWPVEDQEFLRDQNLTIQSKISQEFLSEEQED